MADVPFFVKPLAFIAYTDTGANASNLAEFQFSGMTWKTGDITGASAQFTADFGSPQTFDFIGILGANAQASTLYYVEADDNGTTLLGASPAFTTGPQQFIYPAVTGRQLYNSHFELATPQTRRAFALVVAGHVGSFEAAFMVIGKKVQPSKYYEPEWDAGPVDLSTLTIGRNGVPDIAPGLIQRTIGFTLGWQTEAEFQTQMQPLANAAGKVNPVYLCFDPEPTTYRQDRTYFGRFTDSLRTTKKGWNRFERQFALQSMI